MRRAWSRKAKGCRLTNAFEAFSCEKTRRHFAFPTLCPDLFHRSRWVGYLLPEDFSMPGLATARPKRELFGPGTPSAKGVPARSIPGSLWHRPTVLAVQLRPIRCNA